MKLIYGQIRMKVVLEQLDMLGGEIVLYKA
jgi:hypothetical protein